MAENLYLVDSNVLLRWVRPNDETYSLVVSAIDAIIAGGGSLFYTSQNVGEFWNVCTRPKDRNGFGLSPLQTDALAKTFERELQLLPDSSAVHEEWRKILLTDGVSGAQVHDARLVAAMRVHRVHTILTFDQTDFARWQDIQALDPASIPSK